MSSFVLAQFMRIEFIWSSYLIYNIVKIDMKTYKKILLIASCLFSLSLSANITMSYILNEEEKIISYGSFCDLVTQHPEGSEAAILKIETLDDAEYGALISSFGYSGGRPWELSNFWSQSQVIVIAVHGVSCKSLTSLMCFSEQFKFVGEKGPYYVFGRSCVLDKEIKKQFAARLDRLF